MSFDCTVQLGPSTNSEQVWSQYYFTRSYCSCFPLKEYVILSYPFLCVLLFMRRKHVAQKLGNFKLVPNCGKKGISQNVKWKEEWRKRKKNIKVKRVLMMMTCWNETVEKRREEIWTWTDWRKQALNYRTTKQP